MIDSQGLPKAQMGRRRGNLNEALSAKTIQIKGHGGDEIEAYLAKPETDQPFGSVVVIHHMPGYDAATKEIARRFAAHGYAAICPNLYTREAPGADPDDAAATARAKGGVPDERLVGDVAGAAATLRALPGSNQKVAVIGYCSGGRQSFLAAISLKLDAAVVCYGAFIVGTPPEASPLKVTPLLDRAKDLSCPLLGLFGAEDSHPSPEQTAELEAELKRLGKQFDFHTFENAGHGFFATDRPSYRPEAAGEGWALIWDFFGKNLQ
jgi:carboxymethylenebutenolidase